MFVAPHETVEMTGGRRIFTWSPCPSSEIASETCREKTNRNKRPALSGKEQPIRKSQSDENVTTRKQREARITFFSPLLAIIACTAGNKK
jgi:hypothetical protein